MRHAAKCGFLGLIFLFAQSILLAQSGEVTGKVLDENQAPLARVEVQLINHRSAQVLRDQTASDGSFRFTRVPAGNYSLSLVHEHYTAWRSEPFEILPGIPVTVPVVLIRPLQPALTNPRSGLEEMALEYGLVREQIEALPIVIGSEGRTTLDKLLHLVPGLTPVTALDIDPFTGRAASVSANGSRRSFINYKLDGVLNNAQNRITGAQAASFGPAPEAIDSLRVITHTYSSREGRNAGAVVAPVLRSGSDQWQGHLRGFMRPSWSESFGSFDGSRDKVAGWVGGAQIGGPLWPRKKLYMFLDGEGWLTNRRHESVQQVLTNAIRAGNFTGSTIIPEDPLSGVAFPNSQIPATRMDPVMQNYLEAFLPRPNLDENLLQASENMRSSGQLLFAKVDMQAGSLAHHMSHYVYRNRINAPLKEELTASPGIIENRRQVSNLSQYALNVTISPDLVMTQRLAFQQLSNNQWSGHPAYRNLSAESFGFNYQHLAPETIPNVRLWTDTGQLQLHIAPFINSEKSIQTTIQLGNDIEYRRNKYAFRGGVLAQLGYWPFTNSENNAGSFSFPTPPRPPIRSRGHGLRDLLLGRPGEFRLQTQRSLDLRWHEFAAYGEVEWRPFRTLKVTAGLRYEQQPPATDSLDRLMTFREGGQSTRFPDSPPNLLFPGDIDPDGGILPRSTIVTKGRNIAPRIGIAYSPVSNNRWSRLLLGESGRSVFRASYGSFFDHGTFAGASAAALFQATFPPFSVDNRFTLRDPEGAFQSPIMALPSASPTTFLPNIVQYSVLVFDPNFENAHAHHWNFSWQRLLPGRIFFTSSFLGTRSLRLDQQNELNHFVNNPLRSFAFVHNMRRFSHFRNIRSFQSTGGARYQALQFRANRYLFRGLGMDVGYNWSHSYDNGSNAFGDELVGEEWTYSNFDRRHSLTVSWQYRLRLPRDWQRSFRWIDSWSISGVWRLRSGLPLDIKQNEDPTYTFQRVGRPDRIGNYNILDPSSPQTFTLQEGRSISGRFAFDPTVFQAVRPTNFNQTRQGTSLRNEYRMRGFQQWDMRFSRPIETTELVSLEIGFDLLNVFNSRNWSEPFSTIDHSFFGIVRLQGFGRTFQGVLKLVF